MQIYSIIKTILLNKIKKKDKKERKLTYAFHSHLGAFNAQHQMLCFSVLHGISSQKYTWSRFWKQNRVRNFNENFCSIVVILVFIFYLEILIHILIFNSKYYELVLVIEFLLIIFLLVLIIYNSIISTFFLLNSNKLTNSIFLAILICI